ncbi:E3 ubiquitin-protein ligase BRE1 [Scheffersomyces xylosifermentans]|uniref:E3 ubiquitin-protein ligase BRE1 n=1 Tax=Scheffersomyces xylosifermentans TaxID=1304137 RepID=UPI00315DA763
MSSSEIERKRSVSDTPSVDAKRQKPLQELSEDGPLTQSDVVYFQKEAIWRQMVAYKEKTQSLSRQLRKLEVKYESNQRKLHVLDSWYGQIINVFSSKVKPSSKTDENLLAKLNDIEDSVLQTRRNEILQVLTPLIENVKSASASNSEVLVEKLEILNSELASIQAENQTLLASKADLEVKIDELQQEIFTLTKQKERQHSKTLKRVDDSIYVDDSNGSVKHETSENATPLKQDSTHSKEESEAKGEIKSEESNIDKEEIERITAQLEELTSTNTLLTKQIQEITEKYNKSQQEIVQLDNKLHHLEEADLADNAHFKRIVKNNQRLQEQISQLSKINSGNIAKLNDLEKNQDNIKDLIQKEILEENENLKQQLHKSETDLVRIRTARDDLISKQAILKSQVEDQKTNDELKNLNKVFSDRISQLESEQVEKLSEDTNKLNDLTKEELIARINLLSKEIKEIELAFKQTRDISLKKLNTAVDDENLIRKLTIEKTKADQKYFASMRLKDSLQSENKVMKAQIGKSQELIKNFNDLEKNYLNKIEILNKSLNDYKAIKENSLQENTQLLDSMKSLQASKESLEKEIKRYSQVVESKTAEITSLQAELNRSKVTNTKLEKNLNSTESLLKKYKQNNTSSILQEDEQQLEALRSIAKCSVCSKNWKDTAITVCGHVFCHSCTQERLAARLRRCPSCNKGFSANDLLSVHL